MYIRKYVCMYVCMYLCMYMYMYMHTHTYIYICIYRGYDHHRTLNASMVRMIRDHVGLFTE